MIEIRTMEELNRFHAETPAPGVGLLTVLAEWCAPSRRQRPILETVGEAFSGRVRIALVDADRGEEVCEALEIRTLPSSLVFVNGELAESLPGFQQEQYLRDYLDHYLQLNAPPAAVDR